MTSEILYPDVQCAENLKAANPAEPLIAHEVPTRPWAKVGVDLFQYDDRNYLVTVDYMSNFWEVDYLPTTDAKTIITKLKHHFARHGIPDQVVSDNGPQFSCQDFTNFAYNWSFIHTPVSPRNSKSNGKAESAVKMAKYLFRKAKDDRQDPYLAMLDHRNTPSLGCLSPAQKLMSRRTKALLPTGDNLLKPEPQKNIKQAITKRQESNRKYHDKRAKPLEPLRNGDVVRMKPYHQNSKEWKKSNCN